ncbi:MAG: hypothetical protein ACOY9D_01925 [Pseudomonadota bacterium]
MNIFAKQTFYICLLSIGGCATTAEFNSTPKNASEFTKEKSYLVSNYSDIVKYDRTFASPEDAPPVQKLEKIWGEPNKIEKRWGDFVLGFGLGVGLVSTGYLSYPLLAVVYIMNPYPQEKYVWNKGDYEVTAFGRSEVLTRYEKRIHSWKWKKVEGKEDFANNTHQ